MSIYVQNSGNNIKCTPVWRIKTLGFASTGNSKVIEIYGDKIRVSHGFDGRQKLWYIAEICRFENKEG